MVFGIDFISCSSDFNLFKTLSEMKSENLVVLLVLIICHISNIFAIVVVADDNAEYEENIVFSVYNDELDINDESITFNEYDEAIWDKDTSFLDVCKCSGPVNETVITFIIHGWYSSRRPWIRDLKTKFYTYRGGCTIIVNWGFYSNNYDYNSVVYEHFDNVVAVIKNRIIKVNEAGFLFEKMLLYGHSIGAWIAIEAGLLINDEDSNKKIKYIDGMFSCLLIKISKKKISI